LVQGTMAQVKALLRQTQGSGTINTAYIERVESHKVVPGKVSQSRTG
jgi:hypothetical protein